MLSKLKLDYLEDGQVVGEVKEFLRDRYLEEVRDLEDKPFASCLYISMKEVQSYDPELYTNFEDSPKIYLYNADVALQMLIEEETIMDEDEAREYVIRLTEYDGNILDIQDIRKDDLTQLVTIEGSVSQNSDVTPILTEVVFRCLSCREQEIKVVQEKDDPKETTYPSGCPNCDNKSKKQFRPLPEKSTYENYQHLVIQEHPEKSPAGETPQEVDVMIHGDITGEVTPGERVTVIGILTPILKLQNDVLKATDVKTQIKGISVIPDEQDYEELEITEEDIEKIEELSNQEDLFEQFVQSVAPAIQGYEEEKLGIVLQMFGGERKEVDESNHRGDIHILLVGDPSTGKSQILQHVEKLSPRGMYASGKGVSEAGLTAAATQKGEFGNKWVLEAGVLPLSDKGIACVDEIDKMDKSDRGAMHEAMEQQQVSINKADINTTLQSRCALLAAANPDGDRFDQMASVPKQIDLEPALVSRFDLMFVFKDEIDEEQDRKISNHILETHIKGAKKKQDKIDEDKVRQTIDPELMKKYIAHARQEYSPIIQQDARQYLQETYLDIRSQGGDTEDVIPVTHRKLEAAVRLAEASARVRLSNEATLEDAERAVDLVDQSLRQTGYDEEADRYDSSKIEMGESRTKSDRKKAIINIIENLNEDEETESTEEKIIERAKSSVNIDKEKARETYLELKTGGEIYENSKGIVKVIQDD